MQEDLTIKVGLDATQMKADTEHLMQMLNKLGYEAGKGGQTLNNSLRIDGSVDEAIRNINNGLQTSLDTLESISHANQRAMSDIQNTMNGLIPRMDSLESMGDTKGVNALEQQYDVLESQLRVRKELQEVITSQIRLQTQEATEHVSLRTQLMKVRNEMGALKLAGKENTDEYQRLRTKAEQLAKAQKELGKEISVLGMKHPMMAGVIQGFQGLSGAMSVASGVTGMLAGENENLQRIMAKVQSMMAITIGLQQVMNTLDDNSAFKIGFLNKVLNEESARQNEMASATDSLNESLSDSTEKTQQGTVLVKGFGSALKKVTNALFKIVKAGGAVMAIGLVALKVMKKFIQSIKDSVKEAEEFRKKVSDSVSSPIQKLEELSAQWKRLDGLSEQNKFIKNNKKAFDELGISITNVKDAQKLLVDYKDTYIQYLIDIATAEAYASRNTDKFGDLADKRQQLATMMKEQEKLEEIAEKNKRDPSKWGDNSLQPMPMRGGAGGMATMGGTSTSVYRAQDYMLKSVRSSVTELKKDIAKLEKEMQDNLSASLDLQEKAKSDLEKTGLKLTNEEENAVQTKKSEDILGKTLQLQIQNVNKELTDLFGTLRDGELAGNPFLALQYQLDELYTQLGEHKKELARQEIKDETLLAETIKSIDNETADNKKNIADKIQQYNQKQIGDRQAQIDNQVKQEKELYAELLLNYGDYQQQCKDINEKYTNAINLATKKGNQQLVATLRKQWEKELGERASEFFSQRFAKALKSDATKEELQSALDEIDELINSTYSDGNKWGINAEAWEQAVKSAKEIRKQINELAKQKNIPIVQMLKDIKESFASGDINTAMEGIMNMASLASQAVDQLASTFRELADATGSANLDKTATALEKVGTFLNETGTGASVGASVGGGWGALVGAIIGSGVGTFKLWAESEKELAEAQAKREQEGTEALQVNTQTLLDTISAMNSLADTISSLDYGQFSTVIQDALNQLNSDIKAYDSENNWRNINNALQSVDFQKRQNLEREYVEWLKANGYDPSGYFDNNLTDTQATANMVNNLDYEHIQRLKELWRELSEFQRSGENDSLKLWNIQNKILIEKKNGLENEIAKYKLLGWDTAELENQLASLNLQIKSNVQTMVEGLLGVDLNGIIDNWISIFNEFGDSSAMVFDKISASIDDMVANILRQQFLIKPLSKELQDIMKEADVDGDNELTYDEVMDVAGRIGAFKESAYDLWKSYREALEQAGIDTAVAGTTMSSAIKGISEETARIIAGQMNAIRVHQIEMLDVMRGSIANNVQTIADNTGHLVAIDTRLARIENVMQSSQYQSIA